VRGALVAVALVIAALLAASAPGASVAAAVPIERSRFALYDGARERHGAESPTEPDTTNGGTTHGVVTFKVPCRSGGFRMTYHAGGGTLVSVALPGALIVHGNGNCAQTTTSRVDASRRVGDARLVVVRATRRPDGDGAIVALEIQLTHGADGKEPSPYASPTAPAEPFPTRTPTPLPTAGKVFSIFDFRFRPKTLRITPGTTVIWRNGDRTEHTVTLVSAVAPDNSPLADAFDSGPISARPPAVARQERPAGGSFSYRFVREGRYSYSCTLIPSMSGTIVVVQASVPPGGIN
jgi:plastocyanin